MFDAYRTAFGMLLTLLVVLALRAAMFGELGLVSGAPLSSSSE